MGVNSGASDPPVKDNICLLSTVGFGEYLGGEVACVRACNFVSSSVVFAFDGTNKRYSIVFEGSRGSIVMLTSMYGPL